MMEFAPDKELLHIISLSDQKMLLSDDTLEQIFDVQDEVIRARILIAARARAKKLGCLNDMKILLEAYQKREKEILSQQRQRAKDRGGTRYVKLPDVVQNDFLIDVLKTLPAEDCDTSDKGFARLFAEVFKSKHAYNPTRRDWMSFDGKRWVDDPEGLQARASAKALSDALMQYAVTLGDDGKYLKAVIPLCNLRNRNNMLMDSRDINFITNDQLDTDDYTLNVQNGVLDLSTDISKFLPHDPSRKLSKICNVEYNPAAVCPVWMKFLDEIMERNAEKIRYLQKIAGLSLTGCTKEETAFFLFGEKTRNGKSTYTETQLYLLGDYAITMKPESLAVKQNNDSRTASGDIARLAGARLVNASEPPKRMLFDTALLKSMLGRDSITARFLHQGEFTFMPKFKLVINTNYLPTITDDTIFSSGRINVISFDRHFEPQEQDKGLKERLRQPDELSGILNWCIEGLRLYRKEGLEPPQAVQDATAAYRSDSDKLGNFIGECLIESRGCCSVRTVYERYSEWCRDNGFGLENKGNFVSELKSKGLYAATGTINGRTVRNVLVGYDIDTDFSEITDENGLPFD